MQDTDELQTPPPRGSEKYCDLFAHTQVLDLYIFFLDIRLW